MSFHKIDSKLSEFTQLSQLISNTFTEALKSLT